MRIDSVQIGNFGKFNSKKICFRDGINIVEGPNGSGKTTIYTFIMKMLFGMERMRGKAAKTDEYTVYEPWEQKNIYEGKLFFSLEDKHFCLERGFYKKERFQRLYNIEDGEELSVEQGDLQVLLNDLSENIYKNTLAFSQNSAKTTGDLSSQLKSYIAGEGLSKENRIDIEAAKKSLKEKKKERENILRSKSAALELKYAALRERLEFLKETQAETLKLSAAEEEKDREMVDAKKRTINIHMILLVVMVLLTGGLQIFSVIEIPKSFYAVELVFMAAFMLECNGFYRFKISCKWRKGKSLAEKSILEEKTGKLAEAMEALIKPDKEEIQLREEIEALELAAFRIEESVGELQKEILINITDKMSGILNEITDGEIKKAGLDSEGNLFVSYCGRKILPEFLSRGCMEQLYFAYRYTVFDLLNEEENMMILLDDAFVYYDDERMGKILKWLSKQKRQIILFTCQKREESYLKAKGIVYHKVELART